MMGYFVKRIFYLKIFNINVLYLKTYGPSCCNIGFAPLCNVSSGFVQLNKYTLMYNGDGICCQYLYVWVLFSNSSF